MSLYEITFLGHWEMLTKEKLYQTFIGHVEQLIDK